MANEKPSHYHLVRDSFCCRCDINLIRIAGALVVLRVDIEVEGTGLVSHNMANVPVMNKYEKN
jgi:hypothetical protein